MPRSRDRARLGWQLAAVALAYLLWLEVKEEKLAYRQIEVPLRFENLSPTLALRERPTSVVVRVRAPDPLIKSIGEPDVEALVDLEGLGEGTHLIRLSAESPYVVALRPGVDVDEVFPAAVRITLEPKLTADVLVRAVLAGTPAKGYELGEVRVEPGRVRIEGPASATTETIEVVTREVDVEGRMEGFSQEVHLEVRNPEVMIMSEPRARVTVSVREIQAERTFAELPIAPLGTEHGARLRPDHATVTLGGPEALLARLQRTDLIVFVDLSGLIPSGRDYRLPLQVDFTRDLVRERVRVKALSADDVAVRVLERKAEHPDG